MDMAGLTEWRASFERARKAEIEAAESRVAEALEGFARAYYASLRHGRTWRLPAPWLQHGSRWVEFQLRQSAMRALLNRGGR